jgi:hypothetical protein
MLEDIMPESNHQEGRIKAKTSQAMLISEGHFEHNILNDIPDFTGQTL